MSLWKCFWKRIWLAFAASGALKLLGDATTLIGPMAISKIIDYASDLQNSTMLNENFSWKVPSRPLNYFIYNISICHLKDFIQGAMTFSQILKNGYFLGILVFFATILQSTISQASTHMLCVEGIRLRTALQVGYYHVIENIHDYFSLLFSIHLSFEKKV